MVLFLWNIFFNDFFSGYIKRICFFRQAYAHLNLKGTIKAPMMHFEIKTNLKANESAFICYFFKSCYLGIYLFIYSFISQFFHRFLPFYLSNLFFVVLLYLFTYRFDLHINSISIVHTDFLTECHSKMTSLL